MPQQQISGDLNCNLHPVEFCRLPGTNVTANAGAANAGAVNANTADADKDCTLLLPTNPPPKLLPPTPLPPKLSPPAPLPPTLSPPSALPQLLIAMRTGKERRTVSRCHSDHLSRRVKTDGGEQTTTAAETERPVRTKRGTGSIDLSHSRQFFRQFRNNSAG